MFPQFSAFLTVSMLVHFLTSEIMTNRWGFLFSFGHLVSCSGSWLQAGGVTHTWSRKTLDWAHLLILCPANLHIAELSYSTPYTHTHDFFSSFCFLPTLKYPEKLKDQETPLSCIFQDSQSIKECIEPIAWAHPVHFPASRGLSHTMHLLMLFPD